MITANVFLGSNNTIDCQIAFDNEPIKFISSRVRLIEVWFNNTLLADSSTSAVSYDDNGVIRLMLGSVAGLQKTNMPISIKVYDPKHPDGQIIVHKNILKSSLTLAVSSSEL